jgi:hypothetical protein
MSASTPTAVRSSFISPIWSNRVATVDPAPAAGPLSCFAGMSVSAPLGWFRTDTKTSASLRVMVHLRNAAHSGVPAAAGPAWARRTYRGSSGRPPGDARRSGTFALPVRVAWPVQRKARSQSLGQSLGTDAANVLRSAIQARGRGHNDIRPGLSSNLMVPGGVSLRLGCVDFIQDLTTMLAEG